MLLLGSVKFVWVIEIFFGKNRGNKDKEMIEKLII